MNWALAKQNGWRVLLRIEDLDGPRVKAEAARQAIDTLAWLGLDWDEGPVYQSADLSPYRAALARLAADGAIYPCRCTRSQLAAAALSAPNAGDYELCYPGTCRPATPTPRDFTDPTYAGAAWRLRVADGPLVIRDQLRGDVSHDVRQSVGDFVVAAKSGLPAYQLAVVVDDQRQRVTHIVRGDDLLHSTHRQALVQRALHASHAGEKCVVSPPQARQPPCGAPGRAGSVFYWHVPLVVGEDGRRLAKRHGDTRLDTYRAAGVPAARVVGLLAEWCGLGPRRPQTASQFAGAFRLDRFPRRCVEFRPADHAWLLA